MMKTFLGCAVGLALALGSAVTGAASLVEQFSSPVSTLDGHRYVIYGTDDLSAIRWSDARTAAEAAGGYLAAVTTAPEEQFVQDAFAGSRIYVGVTAWMGLSDAASEGDFRWVTGPAAGQPLTDADWRTGEPNNAGMSGNEDYVTWENYPLGPPGGAWNDVAEDELVGQLLVEFDPVLEFLSAPNPANGHVYGIYRAGSFENPISWLGARNAAEVLGGYLATITSETEELFLQDAFAGDKVYIGLTTWIGLSDEVAEGVFRWMTGPEAGQLLGDADWRTGEPNNSGMTGDEDYVTWENYPSGPLGGAWNDAAEGERVFRFMVEFEPHAVPEPPVIGLLAAGLAAFWLRGRNRRRG